MLIQASYFQKLIQAIYFYSISSRSRHSYNSYTKWYASERDNLFSLISYTKIQASDYTEIIPKTSSQLHQAVLKKLKSITPKLDISISNRPSDKTLYYHSAPAHWVRTHTYCPYFHSERQQRTTSTKLKTLTLNQHGNIKNTQALLCSTLFFVWWITYSDCYDLNKPHIYTFPQYKGNALNNLSRLLEDDMKSKSEKRVYNYRTVGRVEYDEFYMKKSKLIIDKIDVALSQYYNFTEEELDYIINYDYKYRMGGADHVQ